MKLLSSFILPMPFKTLGLSFTRGIQKVKFKMLTWLFVID